MIPAYSYPLESGSFRALKKVATMSLQSRVSRLTSLGVLALIAAVGSHADTLKQVTSASNQGSTDTLTWTQKGADGTVLPASFTVNTATANTVTTSLGAANSVVSVVCSASPCSWTELALLPVIVCCGLPMLVMVAVGQ